MSIEDELLRIYRKNKELLESMSAFELMENAGLFARDLRKLVDSQRLPVSVLIGCLVHEVEMLSKQPGDIILDDKLTKSFEAFKRYVDEKFIKKEQL